MSDALAVFRVSPSVATRMAISALSNGLLRMRAGWQPPGRGSQKLQTHMHVACSHHRLAPTSCSTASSAVLGSCGGGGGGGGGGDGGGGGAWTARQGVRFASGARQESRRAPALRYACGRAYLGRRRGDGRRARGWRGRGRARGGARGLRSACRAGRRCGGGWCGGHGSRRRGSGRRGGGRVCGGRACAGQRGGRRANWRGSNRLRRRGRGRWGCHWRLRGADADGIAQRGGGRCVGACRSAESRGL